MVNFYKVKFYYENLVNHIFLKLWHSKYVLHFSLASMIVGNFVIIH